MRFWQYIRTTLLATLMGVATSASAGGGIAISIGASSGYSHGGYGGYSASFRYGSRHGYGRSYRHSGLYYGHRYKYRGSYYRSKRYIGYPSRYKAYYGYGYPGFGYTHAYLLGASAGYRAASHRRSSYYLRADEIYYPGSRHVPVSTTSKYSGVKLLRDRNGECFEIKENAAGEEIHVVQDPARCEWE